MIVNKKLAAAALAGLMTVGAFAAAPASANDTKEKAGHEKDAKGATKEKHACKGQNSCKGNSPDGKNECKGKSDCSTLDKK